MRPLHLVVSIYASPRLVWAHLSDLADHAAWMRDAEAIRFTTGQRSGIGTEMLVPTRVGPFRTTDSMRVVEWEEGRLISVEHLGAVSGTGSFEIVPVAAGAALHWTETLRFPWWLGGRFGAWVARPVLKRVWRGNLNRLRHRIEVSGPRTPPDVWR